MPPNRTCDQCGKPLPPEGRFCAHCGFHSGAPTNTPDPEVATRLGPWERILERLKVVTAGRYDVQRLLGWGGMAGVYLAEELRLKRRVAIKVIAPGLLMDPSQIERFEQEARTTAQLNHPNIVTIYEVDEREDLHYFTMTYVPGRTLGQVMAEASAPLPLGVVEAWVRQVAGALSYAHQRGVVHRDIKPGNILLDEQGNALVGDFGIAKVAEEPGLTRTGMLVGTPAYMSPEQCTTGKVTGASDQYSLGAVAYQMIAGEAPFVGSTIHVIQAHVGEVPRDVREWRADCPDGLAETVMRMLAKSAEDRWPSLYDAVDALGGTSLRHDDPRRHMMASLAAWTHSVRIAPATGDAGDERSHIEVGESLRLEASTLDHRHQELPDRSVEWSVTPDGIVEVDEEGLVQALAVGKARVRGASGRVAAEWIFSVGSPATEPLTPAAGIEAALVNPPAPSLSEPAPDLAPSFTEPPAEPSLVAADRDADGVVDWIEQAEASEDPPAVEPDEIPVAASPGSYTAVISAAAAGIPTPSGDASSGDRAAPVAPENAGALERVPAAENAPAPESVASPPRKTLPLWVPAAGAVVVVAGLALALSGGGDDAEPTGPGAEALPTATTETSPPPPAAATDIPGEVALASDSSSSAEGDGQTAADEPPARTEAPEEQPQTPPPTREATPTRPRVPAEPQAPAPGFVRILGEVPDDAMVRVRGEGVDRASRDRTIELVPGRYTVELRAAGYELMSTELTVSAGGSADWRPTMVLEPAAADTPAAAADTPAADPSTETPDPAEARARAIVSAIEAFGAALQSRDPAGLRRVWPSISSADAAPWEAFMTSRDIRDLRVDVTVPSVPADEGDRVVVPFTLRLRYENPGAPPPGNPIPFLATVERNGDVWVLAALGAGN